MDGINERRNKYIDELNFDLVNKNHFKIYNATICNDKKNKVVLHDNIRKII